MPKLSEESVITEELRNLVGVEQETQVFKVEEGHLRRFAQAIGDFNPLWQDEEYARKSRYGRIVAPPIFLIDMGASKFAEDLMKARCALPGFLNGGLEIEYYKPMVAGDTITTVSKLIDLKERIGKSGKLLFMTVETTHTNQHGELVIKERHNFIRL